MVIINFGLGTKLGIKTRHGISSEKASAEVEDQTFTSNSNFSFLFQVSPVKTGREGNKLLCLGSSLLNLHFQFKLEIIIGVLSVVFPQRGQRSHLN